MTVWRAVILAAGRGPDDPMAKAFGVAHKCTVPIAGKPMFSWVLDALSKTGVLKPYIVAIDEAAVLHTFSNIECVAAENSAPASAISCIRHANSWPILITTGDHPLLTPAMINYVLKAGEESEADVLVALATSETIQASYPETRRTYFNLGGTRVSGCNLFVVKRKAGLALLERWQELEKNRKKPWKLILAFGLTPIVHYLLGTLTPERAFNFISHRLGIAVRPVFMPFAEAAIDVDKPSDHALAQAILLRRSNPA